MREAPSEHARRAAGRHRRQPPRGSQEQLRPVRLHAAVAQPQPADVLPVSRLPTATAAAGRAHDGQRHQPAQRRAPPQPPSAHGPAHKRGTAPRLGAQRVRGAHDGIRQAPQQGDQELGGHAAQTGRRLAPERNLPP